MRKRFGIMLAILFITGAVITVWEVWHSKEPFSEEPIYNGKPLSVWLNDYWILSHGLAEEQVRIAATNHAVDEVVRQIGSNAIPTLFRMLNAKDSPLRQLTYLARDNGFYSFSDHFSYTNAPALAQKIQAVMAFHALGAEGKDAVPRLIAMYQRTWYGPPRELVAGALGGIGPSASNAVPSLLRVVMNADPAVAYNSLPALGEIHANPEIVVPVLVKLLKNPELRDPTVLALRAFGTNARPAVPVLIELLKDEDDYIRRDAAKALKVINPEAAAKAGVQ